jgi:hypothetical protein
MSSGFSGGATRSLKDGPEREIETRFAHFLKSNQFEKDLKPGSPAFSETGKSTVKGSGPYAKAHDDTVPETDASFGKLGAAGDPKDQAGLDDIDREAQYYQSRVKDYDDQFPGALSKSKEKEAETVSEQVERRLQELIRGGL